MTRRTITTVVAVLLAGGASLLAQQAATALKNDREKASYALGMDLGNQLKKMEVDLDPTVFAKGMADALAGARPLMTEAEVQSAVVRLQSALKSRQLQNALGTPDPKAAAANLKAGEDFLAANRKRPGVVVLPSGIQYKVVTAGTGPKPTAAGTVVCHYRGTLIDGTEFDNSYARKQPATLPIKGSIAGWEEVLPLMRVGAKWQVVIPSNLAYGPNGAGQKIGPNATLIFDIELVGIK